MKTKKFELWTGITIALLILFMVFLVYPMFGILKQAVISEDGRFTLEQFVSSFP